MGHHVSAVVAMSSMACWVLLLAGAAGPLPAQTPPPRPAVRESADASVLDGGVSQPAPAHAEPSRPAPRTREKRVEPTRKGLLADLAWARSKYPELHLRADSLADALASWLRIGEEMPVWVTDGRRRCAPDILKRLPNRRESDMSDYDWRFGPAGARLHLVLRGCRPAKPDGRGRARRVCVDHPVGHTWWTNNGEAYETEVHGRWRSTGGYGVGDPIPTYGVLSQITAEAARYRGHEVNIVTRCSERYLRCTDGGYRKCTSCDGFSIFLDEAHGVTGHGFGTMPPTSWNGVPCNEPCPKPPPQPDRARLEGLNALGLWVVEPKRRPFAGFYRSAEACQRDAATFRGQPEDHGAE
jgi:hypothetical protein